MKISICIPQYNRIEFLLRSLSIIESQTYPDIEISISDDCSTDNTVEEITKLIPKYKYPVIFHKNEKNLGYDRNYRKCIEQSTGDYAIVIGNDDSICGNESIEQLVSFLISNNHPDLGFANMTEERTGNTIIKRAVSTQVLGTGPEAALKYYSCFVFVGGLIYKRDTFMKYNTDKYDGSIYAQMYLSVVMISSGVRLFSIAEPIILKDIMLEGKLRNSYRDVIAKKWKEFRVVDGGLPSVINVVISGLKDTGTLQHGHVFRIFKRIYALTYPQWILDYKENHALPEAAGLFIGLNPLKNKNYRLMSLVEKINIFFIYIAATLAAFIMPVYVFKKIRQRVYEYFKK